MGRALLPQDYPFVYADARQAEDLLVRAVTETSACRAQADASAGGNLVDWITRHHNTDDFDATIARRVTEWFGD